MKTRRAAVVLAMLLALAATAGVFMYVQKVKERAQTGGGEVTVTVSTQDIPAGTELDPLIQAGALTTKSIPQDDLIQGAVTDVSQLRGRTVAYPVLAGEQISTARLRGAMQAAGGLLGIPSGYEAVTLSLEPQRIVGGAIQQGDRVTIYGTFQITSAGQAGQAMETMTLVPEVQVLQVGTITTSVGASGGTLLTLALKPHDAEVLVFAQEQGHVWLALLPPNQKGARQAPVTTGSLVR